MSEAFIRRAGGQKLNEIIEVELSDQTKSLIGLQNNGGLNDALLALAYKDANYATVIITVLNPDGSPATDGKVRMIDSGGANITYSVDEYGKCVFKTNNAQANFINDEEYFDIAPETKLVDTIIGTVKTLVFTRQTLPTSTSKSITSNRNIKFSGLINSVSVFIGGGAGGAYSGSMRANFEVRSSSATGTGSGSLKNKSYTGSTYYSGNGYSNSTTVKIDNTREYQCIIGAGGAGGYSSGSSSKRCTLGSTTIVRGTTSGAAGSAGGTTSFGGIISAAGGAGCNGSANAAGGSNTAYAGARVNSGSGYASAGSFSAASGKSYGTFYYTIWARGSTGGGGKMIINNFIYK